MTIRRKMNINTQMRHINLVYTLSYVQSLILSIDNYLYATVVINRYTVP